MTRDLYEILGVEKTATAGEIKRAYRRSALKWHPDRWSGKSFEEQKQANEKMQELNKAYEILSGEDRRKRYDNGEINPTDFDFELEKATAGLRAEMEKIKEMIKILEEDKRRWDEYGKKINAWIERGKDFYHEQKESDKVYARLDTIRSIRDKAEKAEFHDEDWEESDSNLWAPYKSWEEKIENIEIKSPLRGEESEKYWEDGIDTSELDKFKEEIIEVIRKKGEENKKNKKGKAYFWISEAKRCNIKNIEELITEKEIKPEELGKYSNYQAQINNLTTLWEIQSSAEDITNYLWDEIVMKRDYGPKPIPNNFNSSWKNLSEELREEDKKTLEEEIEQLKNQKKTQTPEQQAETQKKLRKREEELKKINESNNEENNWVQEKAKLEKELQKLKDQGNQAKLTKRVKELEGVVEQLKTENEKLKQQIQELKKENDNTPEYQTYLNKKENELQVKQSKLQQLESIISSNNNNNNPWPIIPIIGTVGVVSLLGLIVYKLSRRKVRR